MSECEHKKVFVAIDGDVYCVGCGELQYGGGLASAMLNEYAALKRLWDAVEKLPEHHREFYGLNALLAKDTDGQADTP